MKKIIGIALAGAAISLNLSCAGQEESLEAMMSRGKPASSGFIGKRLAAFELYAGPTYRWKKLPNGNSLQYWRSDIAGFGVSREDDGQSTLCRLIILTDAENVIREIRIVEDGIACGPALR